MEIKVGVVGLGYVGLPLAVEVSKHFPVKGYDVSERRIDDLRNGIDVTMEVGEEELKNAVNVAYTSALTDIATCTLFIITVPTPVDQFKKPDLGPLLAATSAVGSILKENDIVIYESTVYPGCTEDDCVPFA